MTGVSVSLLYAATGAPEPGGPTTEIEGLRWQPQWISHVGCLKGCLDSLGLSVPLHWLSGGTGHAFILNVHERLCPSGWHVLDWGMYELGRNLGIEVLRLAGHHEQFHASLDARREVWGQARKAIAAGLPCYGYDLEIGDYYVIYGYDDVGYYYSGPLCNEGKGPLPWQELGVKGDVGLLMVNTVKGVQAAPDAKVVRDALAFAVAHARSGDNGDRTYVAGLAGYDQWISALESGQADVWGAAYNAQCYLECRRHAVAFLAEAKRRLPEALGPLFEEAIGHYQLVVESLQTVCSAFPTDTSPEHVKDAERVRRARAALRAAKEAEALGVAVLGKLLAAIGALG